MEISYHRDLRSAAFSPRVTSMTPGFFYMGIERTEALFFWSVNSRASHRRDKILVDWQLQDSPGLILGRSDIHQVLFQLLLRDELPVGGRTGI